MKSSPRPQSATSLPRAPRDDAGDRSRKYLIMMAVRIACLLAMVLITPYGWYTWVCGAGAIVLPYLAVVIANVGQDGRSTQVESPERALTAGPSSSPADAAAPAPDASGVRVIRIDESAPHPSDDRA